MKKSLLGCLLLLAVCLAAGEWKNIPYYGKNTPFQGDRKAAEKYCKMDIKTPETKNFPTLIWFHGGGLKWGDKFFPPEIDTNKIAVFTVNYRLAGKTVRHPDYIYDAAAAVSWVLDNIKKYGGDTKKIYISGHSAGGYLAAMIALDRKYLKTFGHSPDELAGVYPVSGQMTTHFQILAERREKNPGTGDLAVDEYAPLHHASKEAPPMIFFCGDPAKDIASRVEENQLIYARMKRIYKHKNVKFVSIPETGHGDCLAPSVSMINDIIKKSSNIK